MDIQIKPLRELPQFAKQIEQHLLCEFGIYDSNTIETLVAHDNDTFLGTVSLIKSDIDHGKYSKVGPWVADLFVPKEHRGRGIARLLINTLIGDSRGIFLWTSNFKLVSFYESLGFTFLEIVNYKPDKIISVMYK